MKMKMQMVEWKAQWGHELTKSRYPNVFRLKKGGHLIRARVKDPTTGKLKEIKRVMPAASELEAFTWLHEAKAKVKSGPVVAQQKRHFGDYALSVLDKKVKRKKLSREKQDNWKYTLEHLIRGVAEYEKVKVNGLWQKKVKRVLVPGFGDHIISKIRVKHVEDWQTRISELINQGKYKPSTANVWLTTFKTIMKEARRELELQHDCLAGVEMFDESMHDPYPEEDPNALMDEQVAPFLELVREGYPQFYAMAVFGFSTGLRGTNISALRCQGDAADINWDTGLCYVRRAAGRLGETRNNTKVKKRYRITLPPTLLEVLRWHVDTQIEEGAPRDSNYLFPSNNGKPRIAQVLNEPFADVSRQLKLKFNLSVSGMRRTYNDLALAADVNNLVVRSISGHQTEKMQEHYTTVWAPRQIKAIGAIMDLMGGKELTSSLKQAEAELLLAPHDARKARAA